MDKGMAGSGARTEFEGHFYVRTLQHFPLHLDKTSAHFPFSYKRAYESMKACPLTFNHPSEAQQLNGLGSKLCDRLAERLKEHCDRNGLQMPELSQKGKCLFTDVNLTVHALTRPVGKKRSLGEGPEPQNRQPAKKAKKAKPYVPALRSGAYGLLLGLATLDENSSLGMTKAQLIDVAQPHCDASFTVPADPTKFYTAWNSMKTLVQKDLVYEYGRLLRRYLLTDEGWEIAKRIQKTTTQGSSNSVFTDAIGQVCLAL
jgi:crossover junction endonuclease MUS81